MTCLPALYIWNVLMKNMKSPNSGLYAIDSLIPIATSFYIWLFAAAFLDLIVDTRTYLEGFSYTYCRDVKWILKISQINISITAPCRARKMLQIDI